MDAPRDGVAQGDRTFRDAEARGTPEPPEPPEPAAVEDGGSERAGWAALRDGVERFVSRRVARAEVDDVVQDVFARLARASAQPARSLPALVHALARRAVADHHEQRAREHARLARLATEPDDPGGEPLTAVEANVASALAFFLEALPPHHRDAVRAVDVEGRSQAELARALGVPRSTVRTRVQRGRAQLRAILRRACEVELDARGGVLACTPRAQPCSCTA